MASTLPGGPGRTPRRSATTRTRPRRSASTGGRRRPAGGPRVRPSKLGAPRVRLSRKLRRAPHGAARPKPHRLVHAKRGATTANWRLLGPKWLRRCPHTRGAVAKAVGRSPRGGGPPSPNRLAQRGAPLLAVRCAARGSASPPAPLPERRPSPIAGLPLRGLPRRAKAVAMALCVPWLAPEAMRSNVGALARAARSGRCQGGSGWHRARARWQRLGLAQGVHTAPSRAHASSGPPTAPSERPSARARARPAGRHLDTRHLSPEKRPCSGRPAFFHAASRRRGGADNGEQQGARETLGSRSGGKGVHAGVLCVHSPGGAGCERRALNSLRPAAECARVPR